MKRFFSIALLFLFASSLFAFPAAVKADCVCYTGADASGDAVPLPDSESLTTDPSCHDQCVLETYDDADIGLTTYEDGVVADEEALADQAASQDASLAIDSLNARLDDGACDCFCGTETQGATVIPGTYLTNGECKDACDAKGSGFSVCALSSSQLPLANGICWSQDDCKTSNDGQWDSVQPAECAPGDHYCYPEAKAVELAVDIGGTTRVFNIGTYINVIYTYGLGAAAIIAVVMIMIGGAQYIIGAGTGGEAVTAAKTRITNAVTGLVLLLSIYVILYAVNPSLTVFKTIEMPRIKPSLFVQGSCDKYEEKGFKVKEMEDSDQCGFEGLVYQDPSGLSISQTCLYDACKVGKCAKLSAGYKCMECTDGGVAAAEKGFTPTASSCSLLNPTPDASKPSERFQCMLAQATDMTGFDYEDACMLVELNCSKVLKCSDYGNTIVKGANKVGSRLESVQDVAGKPYFNICNNNTCPNVSNAPCVAVDTDEVNDSYMSGEKTGYISENAEKSILSGLRNSLWPSSVVLKESQFSDMYIQAGVYNFHVGCISKSYIK